MCVGGGECECWVWVCGAVSVEVCVEVWGVECGGGSGGVWGGECGDGCGGVWGRVWLHGKREGNDGIIHGIIFMSSALWVLTIGAVGVGGGGRGGAIGIREGY